MSYEQDEFPVDEEIPFADAVQQLLSEPAVPIHLLYRLSDMTEAEKADFFEQWLLTGPDRRHEIARHLADLSEANFLVDFGPVFGFCLSDPEPMVRVAALDGLWDATDVGVIPAISELVQNDASQHVRAAAAAALSHFLLMAAWGEVEGVPEDEITAVLLGAYRDPDSEVPLRRAALEALGSVSTSEVQRLIEAAYEGSDPELQLGALFAMGNSADPRWLSILLDEMESPYSEMRIEAARASGTVGHSDAVPALAELAYDDDEEVAATAIEALGLIGGDQALEVLEGLLEDPQMEHLYEVVEMAMDDLDGLANQKSLLSLAEDWMIASDEALDDEDDDLIDLDDLDE